MRSMILLAPLILASCTAPTPRADPAGAAQTVNAPFVVPMDPGAIRCHNLDNPIALAAAVDWATGQARANVLSGRTMALPDPTTVSTNLALYCDANGQENVRTAAAQIGL